MQYCFVFYVFYFFFKSSAFYIVVVWDSNVYQDCCFCPIVKNELIMILWKSLYLVYKTILIHFLETRRFRVIRYRKKANSCRIITLKQNCMSLFNSKCRGILTLIKLNSRKMWNVLFVDILLKIHTQLSSIPWNYEQIFFIWSTHFRLCCSISVSTEH